MPPKSSPRTRYRPGDMNFLPSMQAIIDSSLWVTAISMAACLMPPAQDAALRHCRESLHQRVGRRCRALSLRSITTTSFLLRSAARRCKAASWRR